MHTNEAGIQLIKVTYVLSAGERDGRHHVKAGSKQGSTTGDVNVSVCCYVLARVVLCPLSPKQSEISKTQEPARRHQLLTSERTSFLRVRAPQEPRVESAQKFIKKQPKKQK